MYKKSAGAGGAGAAGALATTGAPNVALYLGVAIVLSIIGLCLSRSSVVLGRGDRCAHPLTRPARRSTAGGSRGAVRGPTGCGWPSPWS